MGISEVVLISNILLHCSYKLRVKNECIAKNHHQTNKLTKENEQKLRDCWPYTATYVLYLSHTVFKIIVMNIFKK